MSEKKVRDCLDWGRSLSMGLQRDKTLVMPAEKTKWALACAEALADEPDVVKQAKREAHFLELAGGNPGDAVNPFDPLTELGKAWWRGYRQCSADSIRDAQDEFHFRLTEDGGWEWTDE